MFEVPSGLPTAQHRSLGWSSSLTVRSSYSQLVGDRILYTTTAGGKNRHGHFDAPPTVVYKFSGPMGGGFLYTTGAEADNLAVNLSKKISTTTV